jgi:hypothetical protein
MIYLDKPYGAVEWLEDDRIVFLQWRGFADGEDYRGLLGAVLTLLASKSSNCLLVDTRKAKVVTPEDQDWINTVWVPAATKAGLKYTAMIMPESVITKMVFDRMESKYNPPPGGGMMYFNNLAEAKAWLRRAPR